MGKDFKIGDETDQQLVTAIAHQYLRAESAFARFLQYSSGEYHRTKTEDLHLNRIFIPERQWEVDVYNAYADFLHHLYEYEIGCFKRTLKSLSKIDYRIADRMINREANVYRNNCISLIKSGESKKFGLNDISYYEEPVPEEFGKLFREARNMNVHADIRRVKSGYMTDYFEKYQKFTLFVFFLGYDHCSNPNPTSIQWNDITKFASAIFNSNR